jgi:T-complex protein 1 subunit zeta
MAAPTNLVNPDAEIVSKQQCLMVNVTAARGLQHAVKSNLGPRGTLKMLVGGAGQIKITKDGNVLLHEMQIQHPTAVMIARTATAQDDITGDGTTSTVLFTGELLAQAEHHLYEGLHPRVLSEGFDIAKDLTLEYLDQIKIVKPNIFEDRETLVNVAKTALRTKLVPEIADQMSEGIVEAVLSISEPDEPIDLHMVEIMTMKHRSASDSRFVRGLVLDHGARHPDMPTRLENCRILTCNVSFEYEKSEHTAGFVYSSAEERERLVESERKFIDDRVRQLIEFKRQVCAENESFVVINQKGVDPLSLDMFAKEGILILRRAKRRNMERLTLACGGVPVNSIDDLTEEKLGRAGLVYETTLGENKFTFVEDVPQGKSVSLLLKGPNDHTINQLKDAARDGLRAVKNAIDDLCVVPGAGAFEIGAYRHLMERRRAVSGKARYGVEAFAKALLVIPKTLASNSGLDVQETLINIENEQDNSGELAGIDLSSGEPIIPQDEGILDNYRVKRQFLYLATGLASQLLLVDEVIRAGMKMGGGN